MGVRTEISLKEVNQIFKKFNFIDIKPTNDGISDTTYILKTKDKKFVLKIYEEASVQTVQNKLKLIKLLTPLPVAKAKSKIFFYKNRPIVLFSHLKGKSLKKANIKQISNLGKTLGKIHKLTKNRDSSNQNIYTKKIMQTKIKENSLVDFNKRYKYIKDIKFKNHGIIHGDLFLDNTKFVNSNLLGVFDFIQACDGDFRFDLAVVINDWCFKKDKLNKKYLKQLLISYNKFSPIKIEIKKLKEYMLYAALAYSINRYHTKYIEKREVAVKDYREFIKKFDTILKEKF